MHNFLNFTGPTNRAGSAQTPPIVLFDDFIGSPSVVLETALPALWDKNPTEATMTESLNGAGGVLRLQSRTDTPAIGNHTTIRTVRNYFEFEKGKRLRMVARAQVIPETGSNGTLDWYFGLSGSTTDPFTAVPTAMLGLFARGNTLRDEYTLETNLTKTGASDFNPAPGLTLQNNRWYELALEYDGKGAIAWYVDGQMVRRDTRVDRFPFGELVVPILSHNTLTAESPEMQIDYIGVVQDRLALS